MSFRCWGVNWIVFITSPHHPHGFDHRGVPPRSPWAIVGSSGPARLYQHFLEENPKFARIEIDRYGSQLSVPITEMSWYEATAYCNWLSRRENLEQCYEPNGVGE